MKTLLTIVTGALVLAGTILPSLPLIPGAAAQNITQKQEAKIVRVAEVTEIVIKNNNTGEIVRRIPVTNQKELRKIAREQILGKLKNYESAEHNIPDPRLEFRDEDGRVVNTISLKYEENIITKKVQEGNIEKTQKIIQGVIFSTTISSNSKYVLISSTTYVRGYIDSLGNEKYYELYDPILTGKFTFYDVQGNLLFDKQFPEGRSIGGNRKVADSGEAFAVRTFRSGYHPDEPEQIVYVFNKNGEEILQIPSIEEYKTFIFPKIGKISHNGKYLSVTIEPIGINWKQITRFYNLHTKQYWDTDAGLVLRISDEGIAAFIKGGGAKPSTDIDLKNYIKEE